MKSVAKFRVTLDNTAENTRTMTNNNFRSYLKAKFRLSPFDGLEFRKDPFEANRKFNVFLPADAGLGEGSDGRQTPVKGRNERAETQPAEAGTRTVASRGSPFQQTNNPHVASTVNFRDERQLSSAKLPSLYQRSDSSVRNYLKELRAMMKTGTERTDELRKKVQANLRDKQKTYEKVHQPYWVHKEVLNIMSTIRSDLRRSMKEGKPGPDQSLSPPRVACDRVHPYDPMKRSLSVPRNSLPSLERDPRFVGYKTLLGVGPTEAVPEKRVEISSYKEGERSKLVPNDAHGRNTNPGFSRKYGGSFFSR